MASALAWMLLLSGMMGRAQAGDCHAASVSAGGAFTCVVLEDGSARCMGFDIYGQLGRPDNVTSSDPNGPPLDFGAGRSVVQLATFRDSSCAILDDHTVSCWGQNSFGQLGLSGSENRPQPTQVQMGTGNQTVQLLSTGSSASHVCAAVAGEGVFCWGAADRLEGTPWFGQPNDTRFLTTFPSKVDLGLEDESNVTVLDMCAATPGSLGTGTHTCVLTTPGGLKCWGQASDGRLGLGNITDTTGLTGASLPSVKLGTGRSAVQISCGDMHTCAVLDNGALKCFGKNDNGQLGYGDTISRGANNTDMGDALKPVDVGKGHTVKQVAFGSTHTCALLDNSQVKCWGDNSEGQLGHHCSNSTWGDSPGQMGDSLPAVSLGPGRTATSITAGVAHSCAVLDDGSVLCWGDNTFGSLGSRSDASIVCPPYQAMDLGSSCTSSTGCSAANVSAGEAFTCAILEDKSARCWGDPSHYQLGRPLIATSSEPNGPPLDFGAGRTVLQVSARIGSSCALLDNHTVSCWGANDAGQLGLDGMDYYQQPTHVQVGTGNQTVQLLSTGSYTDHSCAAVVSEGVFCWGVPYGLKGTPWSGIPNSKDVFGLQVILPSKVNLASSSSSTVAVLDMCAGPQHTCVLTAQLGLKCWGTLTEGQLGLGPITNTTGLAGASLPSVNLGTGRSAVQISCGGSHTCAVLDNGALKCFGSNANGQLGYGDTVSRGLNITNMGDALQPVDVGQGHTVKQVAAGWNHTCALLSDGQVKCWGWNSNGQLGHHCSNDTWGDSPGQMGDSLPAVDLASYHMAVSISVGYSHSCAVLDDGSIKCWGQNGDAELGFQSKSSNVCPPTQAADLGKLCTSSFVASNSIGSNTSLPTPATTPATTAKSPATIPTSPPAATTRSPSPSPTLSAPLQTSGSQTTPTSTPSTSSSSSHSAPAGIIAGAVVAAVVVAALSGFAVWWWRSRRQSRCTKREAAYFAKSKHAPAHVLAVASNEVAMEATNSSGNKSAADGNGDVAAGAVVNTVNNKADVQGRSSTHTASTAAACSAILPGARSTPPLTSTGSHKADARDTNTSRAASAAAPITGIMRERADDMRISWSHITLGCLLGEGGFGKVYKAKWKMIAVAVKVLNMEKTTPAAIRNLHREAFIMSGLRHPCIARVFGVVDEDPHHALVMQYYPKGTLHSYMRAEAYADLRLSAKLHIALQIASGMQFMHENAVPVLHGDLKAANILLTGLGRSIVIADFGLSQAMRAGQEAAVASGALTYSISPPEVLKNPLAPRSRAADVYAFAIVLWEIYTGLPAFQRLRGVDIKRLVIDGLRPPLPADMPSCIAEIVKACWSQDPVTRPSFTDVVEQLIAAAAELHLDCFTDGTMTAASTQTRTD